MNRYSTPTLISGIAEPSPMQSRMNSRRTSCVRISFTEQIDRAGRQTQRSLLPRVRRKSARVDAVSA